MDVPSQRVQTSLSEGGNSTSVTTSSMPEKLKSEAFSLAYIRAIAAIAGANIYKPEWDFGADLAFTRIDPYQPLSLKRGRRYRHNHSMPLPFQVKSSKNWESHDDT